MSSHPVSCVVYCASCGIAGFLAQCVRVCLIRNGLCDAHKRYYVIWTDNESTLPEANPRRQEGKYPMIKVLQGCIRKLSLHSVNSMLILYRTGNMQFAILLSFVTSSSLPPCGLQSTHPPMPCYISPYVIYNICGHAQIYILTS